MTNSIPVAFFPAALDACALYREFIPHLNLPDSVFIFRTGPIDLRELTHCKIAVVQRSSSDDNRKAILGFKSAGLKVIYDLDDNIWNLPPYNPSYHLFNALQHEFASCAREADLITVSTKGLQSATRTGFSTGMPIEIVPNAIDFNLFRPKKIVREDKVVIGWGGSDTHSEDVREVFSLLPAILDNNPKAIMEIVGAPVIEKRRVSSIKNGKHFISIIQKPSKISLHSNSRFRLWVPVSEYPNRLASWAWDIAIAPLKDNRFNRSKSNIKMLEAAAMRIPCLVSDVAPYNEFCSLGGDDLKWLLCNSTDDWKKKLTTLIHDKPMRDAIAQKMYDVAFRFFNAKVLANNWNYVFQKALSL